jgi:serine/threonine-protein kinase
MVPGNYVKIITEPPVLPSVLRRDTPAALSAILLKCLEKGVSQRYASMAELQHELEILQMKLSSGEVAFSSSPDLVVGLSSAQPEANAATLLDTGSSSATTLADAPKASRRFAPLVVAVLALGVAGVGLQRFAGSRAAAVEPASSAGGGGAPVVPAPAAPPEPVALVDAGLPPESLRAPTPTPIPTRATRGAGAGAPRLPTTASPTPPKPALPAAEPEKAPSKKRHSALDPELDN